MELQINLLSFTLIINIPILPISMYILLEDDKWQRQSGQQNYTMNFENIISTCYILLLPSSSLGIGPSSW